MSFTFSLSAKIRLWIYMFKKRHGAEPPPPPPENLLLADDNVTALSDGLNDLLAI